MANRGQNISRRQFLRGDFSGRRPVVRPPWVVAEAEFLSQCNGCGNCREACSQHIIVLTDSGYPQIDFLNGECTFCGDCARSCDEGVFAWSPQATPWQVKAVVLPVCLAKHDVVCRSCGEQCETGAIQFRFIKGGVAEPQVESTDCNGCGACVAPCPVQAISIYHARDQAAGHANPVEEVVCT